ncbi:hypothetical protein BGZ58_011156 [Dissophora ornata]|nr:hypothetical protein BGZ58_011156 [Dissophora ornata]
MVVRRRFNFSNGSSSPFEKHINVFANLKQTIDSNARRMEELEDNLRTDRIRWKKCADRQRVQIEGVSNENAFLKQTIDSYARRMELEDNLRTDRMKWKKCADRQRVQIEGISNDNAALRQTIDSLEDNLKTEKSRRRRAVEISNLLHHNNSELERENADLQRKLDMKSQSYKEMSKNYMDQIRPIRVTDDDTSTIKNRLTQIRVSIEQLIKTATGNRSVNLNKGVALEYIQNSELFAGMVNLEPELSAYHLDLCMESAVMSTLVHYFFQRPLGCIFENNENFEDI